MTRPRNTRAPPTGRCFGSNSVPATTDVSRWVCTQAMYPNPPTTSHTPGSGPGCTIFVKLWQFDPDDRTGVRLDTTSGAYAPAPGRAGVDVMPLHEDAREQVRLERWAPRAMVELAVPGGIELLVIDGGFTEGGETFETQSWLRLPAGATLQATAAPQGCLVWVKAGHLIDVRAVPEVRFLET